MVEVLELSNPIMIDGKKVKKLNYNFDEITPLHYVSAESGKHAMLRQTPEKMYSGQVEFDNMMHLFLGYYAIIAQAEVEGKSITIEDLLRIKGKDLIEVTKIGRNFIILSAEESTKEETPSESPQSTSENA